MTDSIGARLRQARELRNLTLQQVSETTKVRSHYLQALENDDHSAIPSAAQARGFLRIYAEFLGLDLGELIPSPQAPAPAPVETSVPAVAPQQPTGLGNVLASLRQRLARPAGAQGTSVSETAAPSVKPEPEIPAPSSQVEPAPSESAPANETPAMAQARPADASPTVKKNAKR